jgi:hypothetical protein
MNLEGQLKWADKVLVLLDGRPGTALSWATPPRLEEKLGWVRDFRDDLAEWRQWQAIVDLTVTLVGSEGLHAQIARLLCRNLRPLAQTVAQTRLAAELVKFVKAQTSQTKPGERLPGSTEGRCQMYAQGGTGRNRPGWAATLRVNGGGSAGRVRLVSRLGGVAHLSQPSRSDPLHRLPVVFRVAG